MISNITEYQIARQELRDLEKRLETLQTDHPVPDKGLVKAGVRKLIARLHEELALYEGSQELRSAN